MQTCTCGVAAAALWRFLFLPLPTTSPLFSRIKPLFLPYGKGGGGQDVWPQFFQIVVCFPPGIRAAAARATQPPAFPGARYDPLGSALVQRVYPACTLVQMRRWLLMQRRPSGHKKPRRGGACVLRLSMRMTTSVLRHSEGRVEWHEGGRIPPAEMGVRGRSPWAQKHCLILSDLGLPLSLSP